MKKPLWNMILVLLSAMSFSSANLAHQMKESITVITFNQNSGQVEIAHRIYVHDAEVALETIADTSQDLVTDQQAQTDFAAYIISRFQLVLDGVQLQLSLLGQEVDGQHLWIYQEHPYSIDPQSIAVSYDAMMEMWPDQRHVINIEGLGSVKSMQLLNDDFTQVIEN